MHLLRALLLLAPSIPMLFMGEEYGETAPFLYFCDFHGELADAVREGRRREFSAFPEFAGEKARAAIPDPNDERTFLDSKLDWSRAQGAAGRRVLDEHRRLLALRAREVAPRIAKGAHGKFQRIGDHGLHVDWTLGDGSTLHFRGNFGEAPLHAGTPPAPAIHVVGTFDAGRLGPWSAVWALEAA
jgi:1,4-alpha-glucan branching enzyme